MGKDTTYKEPKNFSKSVGSGVKSVFGGQGRTYYVLEHKTSSEKHRAGESQEIIIDYIELGRDPNCQVYFGESFPTVSRRHAAITKDGENWVLKQLSEKNPTLINGKAVKKQWFLQNGDEIQLSYEGPKLGFLIPSNNSVGSIRLSKRLELFREQALRPYRQAITALSVIFVVALGLLSFIMWQQIKKAEELERVIDQYKKQLTEAVENAQRFEGNIDSLHQVIEGNTQAQGALKRQIDQLKGLVESSSRQVQPSEPATTGRPDANVRLNPLYPNIYFIRVDKIRISFQGNTQEETEYKWSGTGFLLKDKRFVTARHVIESWSFLNGSNPVNNQLNLIANNGGSVEAYFTAYSPDGSTIKFKTSDFTADRSGDVTETVNVDGNMLMIKRAPLGGGKDWATYKTRRRGIIDYDNNLSNNLEQQTRLHILGYPLGLGAEDIGNISPIYGNCIVSSNGLRNGLIYVTDRNFEQGNSGGPVFIKKNNRYIAIGIVSAGAGGSTGFIIPISATR